MNREVHVRFWESAGVRFPRATRRLRDLVRRTGDLSPVESARITWSRSVDAISCGPSGNTQATTTSRGLINPWIGTRRCRARSRPSVKFVRSPSLEGFITVTAA